jgi:DNA ligase D-like protein (predicted ligase)
MLATLVQQPFSDRDWLYERKLDGVRVISSRNDGEPVLWSRNHLSINATYPEIVTALARQGGPRFVVDGEIVAFDGKRTSFAKLQPRMHLTKPDEVSASSVRVFYYLFDLLYYDNSDLRDLPLRKRKALLSEAFDFGDPLRLSQHRNRDGTTYFAQAQERGWEGLIAKRADSHYRAGRSTNWLKIKSVNAGEFVVGGFTDPQGSREGFGALLLGYYEKKKLHYSGKVGTGYNSATLRTMRSTLDKIEIDRSPFADRVTETGRHWTKPTLVVQVGFTEWTKDGRLRHPRFLGVREDKKADEVHRENR